MAIQLEDYPTLRNDANLICYWRMEDDATDEIGSYNGTASNVTYGDGVKGRTGLFNGSSSKIVIDKPTTLGNSVTVSMYVKFNSLANQQIIFNESGNNHIGILITTSGELDLLNKTTTTSFAEHKSATGLITTGVYYLITYVYNASTGYLKGYIDDTEVISTYRGGNQSYGSETKGGIGAYVYSNGASAASYGNCSIDEVFGFSRALSATEISDFYNAVLATTNFFQFIN